MKTEPELEKYYLSIFPNEIHIGDYFFMRLSDYQLFHYCMRMRKNKDQDAGIVSKKVIYIPSVCRESYICNCCKKPFPKRLENFLALYFKLKGIDK